MDLRRWAIHYSGFLVDLPRRMFVPSAAYNYNPDWVAKRIGVARTASLLQLLLLSVYASLYFETITFILRANVALSDYFAIQVPSAPSFDGLGDSVSQWDEKHSSQSEPEDSGWRPIENSVESVRVIRFPATFVGRWQSNPEVLAYEGALKSCGAAHNAALVQFEASSSDADIPGILYSSWIYNNRSMGQVKLSPDFNYGDLFPTDFDFSKAKDKEETSELIQSWCKGPLSQASAKAHFQFDAALAGITATDADLIFLQIVDKLENPSGTVPLIGATLSGLPLFWSLVVLSLLIGIWNASLFRVLSAQPPLDGREPWSLVDPIVFPDDRISSYLARVIEFAAAMIVELIAAFAPVILVKLGAASNEIFINLLGDLTKTDLEPLDLVAPGATLLQQAALPSAWVIAVVQCLWITTILLKAVASRGARKIEEN